MNGKVPMTTAGVAVTLAALVGAAVVCAQDRNTLRVPGGLSFSEFKGYERWQVVSMSKNGALIAVILGNPAMVGAYQSGIPGNGQPFPNGARLAKIHWNPKTNETAPGQPLVPGSLHDIDFMVKDSQRFADSGGWGYAEFEYDAVSGSFRPGTLTDKPPQGNDAKCGFACHTVAAKRDFVFTEYPPR